MTENKLIHPPAPERESSALAPQEHYPDSPLPAGAYYPSFDDDDDEQVDIRRYLSAVLRYKWLLALALMVGSAGAYVAWTKTPVSYTAQGNLWIEVEPRQGNLGDVTPIRASALVQPNAWIELLRSYQVLDTVAVRERLYLSVPSQFEPAFERFSLAEQYRPGSYRLEVGASGADFVLTTGDGALVQQGSFGVAIAENMGFLWAPPRGSFPPGAVVDFSVLSPRDAAQTLSGQLDARVDRSGNFMRLSLSGSDPDRIASILNSVMHRHVAVAADLKSLKLEETLLILEDQLRAVEDSLARAERQLEEFRIQTITLPTDQSMPIAPGIEIARDPVYGAFFENKVQVEQLRRDRERLQAIVDDFDEGQVRIEALEIIPAAGASTELRRILDELVEARSELRVFRDRYSDDYPPIQELLVRINTMESEAIPNVVDGIMTELRAREAEMNGYVQAAASDLEAIPPRTIELGRLERKVASTENLYNNVRGRVEAARLARASSIPDVSILDEAAPPRRPSQDMRLPLAAGILFGCLGIAMTGAILLDRMDARFRYAGDVSRDIGLDILGSIPRIEPGKGRKGVVNAAQALEAFRELRIHVGFAYGSAGPITLVVTSPSEGEGKSLVASNLAVAFSEVGKRTLLLDGDTRRGDAHRLLGRERTPGLIDYLREQADEDIIQATDHPNLDFIGSGSRGVSTPELLASPRMTYFMGTLKRTYDVIIVDSPPLASGGDPLILGALAGNMAVVIRTGTTERGLAQAKLDQLGRLPIRILGAVLNDISPTDSYHSYYTSYLASYEPLPEVGDTEATQLLAETPSGGADDPGQAL